MIMAANRDFSENIQKKIQSGTIPTSQVDAYHQLVARINKELLTHRVITSNEFTAWFKAGSFDKKIAQHFLVQFSVFSNLFIVAQLKKVLNAPTLESMRASKEILLNELGVSFRNPKATTPSAAPKHNQDDEDEVEREGTVEGGTFRFTTAHFEWLLRMVNHLDLTYNDVGKRRHGTKETLFFCDELARLYGSEDPHIALGASFAVENWAAAGFWKELIQGYETYKQRECPKLPLGFFKWHDLVEDQHARHTWDELEEDFFESETEVDQDKFINGGKEMLDGVWAFWDGLNQHRLALVH